MTAAELVARYAVGEVIEVCVDGDDRERPYAIRWLGTAEVFVDGNGQTVPLALVVEAAGTYRPVGERERAVVELDSPDDDGEPSGVAEWRSLGSYGCRDTEPVAGCDPLDDARLRAAV